MFCLRRGLCQGIWPVRGLHLFLDIVQWSEWDRGIWGGTEPLWVSNTLLSSCREIQDSVCKDKPWDRLKNGLPKDAHIFLPGTCECYLIWQNKALQV